jgi:hypothetical protein
MYLLGDIRSLSLEIYRKNVSSAIYEQYTSKECLGNINSLRLGINISILPLGMY